MTASIIKLRQRWRRFRCVHWFGPEKPYSYGEYRGPIVCTEQNAYTVQASRRECLKCGYTDSIVTSETYRGWE